MLHALAKNWWLLAVRGAVAVLFGVLTFLMPGITLITLTLLFGVYALCDGLFNIMASFRSNGSFWALLLEGVVSVIAGLGTIVWPGITALALLYLIAAWAIFTGVLEIVTGIRLRKEITHEWRLILMGAASLFFGVVILLAPVAGALGIVLWIGAYAIIFGILMLVLAFRLRGHERHIHGVMPLPT
jgi:uncharacterized membrane protein HdeD (DUF308 family)